MSKRKTSKSKLASLILLVCGVAAAVISLFGLTFNFVTLTTIGNHNVDYKLGKWSEFISNMNGSDKIANWQTARFMLIATTVLLFVMVVLLVLQFFVKHPALKWTTAGAGLLVLIGALVFMVTAFAGCSALSTTSILGDATYTAKIGVYWFGIGAVVSAILTEVMVMRK